MKKNIHPGYTESVFRCACGAEIPTVSTKDEYRIEICSSCHPFFTGKQKLVDSAGRVERFMKKYGDKPVATGKKSTGKTAKQDKPVSKLLKPKKEKAPLPKEPGKKKGAKEKNEK